MKAETFMQYENRYAKCPMTGLIILMKKYDYFCFCNNGNFLLCSGLHFFYVLPSLPTHPLPLFHPCICFTPIEPSFPRARKV